MWDQKNAAGAKRSEKFYMDTVVFKVEDTLFKVPKAYFVKNSSIFRDMFTLPLPDQANHEGSSDDHPLFLEHVKAEVFAALLEYMYPEQVHEVALDTGPRPSFAPTNKSYELLEALIELARRWMFRGLHSQLVREFGSSVVFSPVDSVASAKKHGIPDWLRAAYIRLATLSVPLSLNDAKQLGWEDAVRIFHLREKFAAQRNTGREYKERLVCEAFAEELQAVEREYKEFYSGQD